MNNVLLDYVEDRETSEFYPTPEELVERMCSKVDWKNLKTILEPSAGKGDIIRGVALHEVTYRPRGFGETHMATKKISERNEIDVDAIEIDGNLREILKRNFSKEYKYELEKEMDRIIPGAIRRPSNEFYTDHAYHYEIRDEATGQYIKKVCTEEENEKLAAAQRNVDAFFKEGIHIVGDDFLTYRPFKTYDLIIMNPSFSDGCIHLLKALDMQKRGGQIVCLLNAETIRNPYTVQRQQLVKLLDEYEADIEYIDNAFHNAERPTGVEVALIYVNIPENDQGESSIYDRMEKARSYKEPDFENSTEIEVTDLIEAIVNRYLVEIESGIELIRTYKRMEPHLRNNFDSSENPDPMIQLTMGSHYENVTINSYVKQVRLKYWRELLSNKKFVGRLTSSLQEMYQRQVNSYADYDFSMFNIKNLLAEMNTHIRSGIETEIIEMYDTLTEEHSYYPECSNNRHYFNGWSTNKAWKIDKKTILPVYSIFDSWDGKPNVYNAYNAVADIERILNFFAGTAEAEINSSEVISRYLNAGTTKNIPLKYFDVTFYKKGTMHLKYKCPELIERFNIYAAQNKKWLPPCYGKKKYSQMTAEEKAIVDDFQGEAAYNKVMSQPGYYLTSPTDENMPVALIG